jgi:hypothetical protein
MSSKLELMFAVGLIAPRAGGAVAVRDCLGARTLVL